MGRRSYVDVSHTKNGSESVSKNRLTIQGVYLINILGFFKKTIRRSLNYKHLMTLKWKNMVAACYHQCVFYRSSVSAV